MARRVRAKNPLRRDPTRTTGLRLRFLRELHKRFVEFRRELRQLLVTEDAFGLNKNFTTKLKLNAEPRRWAFVTDDRKVTEFRDWLDDRINKNFLNVKNGTDAWTAKYIESAYKQGMVRAWIDTHRRDLGLSGKQDSYEASKAQFLRDSFGAGEAASKLKLLMTRTYESLRGISGPMATVMSRTLADGLAYGYGVMRIAKNLENTLGLMEARARTIARTEIMHAHAEGQLDSFEELGVEELGVMAEWSTAGDERVCPVCAPLEGTILTIAEARGMIPRHPNCRCTWIPANVSEKEKGQKRKKGTIASAIKKSLRRETGLKDDDAARARSRWVGADKNISGKKSQTP